MIFDTIGIISANYTGGDFGNLTQRRTSASLPFGGRYRLVDFALSNMVNSGIATVGLITPYYHRSLLDHVGEGKAWGLARKSGGMFLLPGTIYGERSAESRFLLKDIIRNRRLLDRDTADFVICTDSSTVMNTDYTEFIRAHEESGCPISLMYKKEGGRKDAFYLDIDKNNRVEHIHTYDVESENLFLNCFIINRSFLIKFIDWYQAMDNSDFIDILIHEEDEFKINSFEFKGYAGVVNNTDDYKNVSLGLLNKSIFKELFENERKIYTKVQDEPPTIYKQDAKVVNSLVSAGCIIEGTVENSIVFRHATVAKGAVVKNSIIMQNTYVGTDAVIDGVICDKYVKIPEGSEFKAGKNGPIVFGKHNPLNKHNETGK